MHLVRHAAVVVDPNTPSREWPLSGIAVTHGLAISLYAGLSFEAWQALPFPAVVEC